MGIAYLAIGYWLAVVSARISKTAAGLAVLGYFALVPGAIELMLLSYEREVSSFLVSVLFIPVASFAAVLAHRFMQQFPKLPQRSVMAVTAIVFAVTLVLTSPLLTVLLDRAGYYDRVADDLELVHKAKDGQMVLLSVPRIYFETLGARGGTLEDGGNWLEVDFPSMKPKRDREAGRDKRSAFLLPIYLMPQRPGAFWGPRNDTSPQFARDPHSVSIDVPGLHATRLSWASGRDNLLLLSTADNPDTPLYVCPDSYRSDKVRCRRQFSDRDPVPFAYFIDMENLAAWREVEARSVALIRSFIKN